MREVEDRWGVIGLHSCVWPRGRTEAQALAPRTPPSYVRRSAMTRHVSWPLRLSLLLPLLPLLLSLPRADASLCWWSAEVLWFKRGATDQESRMMSHVFRAVEWYNRMKRFHFYKCEEVFFPDRIPGESTVSQLRVRHSSPYPHARDTGK